MKKFTITAKQRLVSKEFDRVFKQGKRFKTDLVYFIYHRTTDATNKIGMVLSKKKVRTAVQRNLLRRIARENFRLHQQLFPYYHIVIMANAPANDATRQDLQTCFQQFFQYLIKRSKRDASG